MAYLLGIDAGTTAVKAAVFDSQGGLAAEAVVECTDSYADGRIAEIEMAKYWSACKQCIRQISKDAQFDLKGIRALSISSQGVTFVPVDAAGREIGKAIIYYDTRALEEAEALLNKFGDDRLYRVTGQPAISAFFEAAKLIWIKNHDKSRFDRIHKVLLVHDYLIFKLIGEFAAVQSMESSSLLFDLRTRDWWPDMLDYVGLSQECFPPIYAHGEPVGMVSKIAAEETGLATGTTVVAGAIDQVCGMIGVGNISEGMVSESTGSVLAIHTVSKELFKEKDKGVYNFCNAMKNSYALINICPTAGAAFAWFKDNFAREEETRAEKEAGSVYELLMKEAGEIAPGAGGLVMLPYLAGRGSPVPNPAARGVFYGFGLHHGKAHFIRALLEAIACLLKSNIEVFKHSGLEIKEIRSFGGGSRSRIWNQIKADLCGIPVLTSSFSEPGCLGAAILAGVGSGEYGTIEQGCARLVSINEPLYPDDRNKTIYERLYQEYLKLNEILEPMFAFSNKKGD